jgi:hypothetical protein
MFTVNQFEYERAGLNPLNGFRLDGPGSLWRLVVGFPLMAASVASAAFVVGMTVWTPAVFIGIGMLAVTWYWALAVYAWLKFRGWHDAISAIEKKRRKAYKEQA